MGIFFSENTSMVMTGGCFITLLYPHLSHMNGGFPVVQCPVAVRQKARQPAAALSSTPAHAHQQRIAPRRLDDTCHAGQVFQHVKETSAAVETENTGCF